MAASQASTPSSSRRVSIDSSSAGRSNASSPFPSAASGSTSTNLTNSKLSTRPRPARSALRDYYNLPPSPGGISDQLSPALGPSVIGTLDRPGFDPDTYVSTMLNREGLGEVLKVEGALVSEIRTLDGEKKGLVYDNYSKLIKATDTIRNMRGRLEPVMPMVKTLGPAINGIEGLVSECKNVEDDSTSKARLVRWVLDAPERCRSLANVGRLEEAKKSWAETEEILDKWNGVQGVDRVRERGKKVFEKIDSQNEVVEQRSSLET